MILSSDVPNKAPIVMYSIALTTSTFNINCLSENTLYRNVINSARNPTIPTTLFDDTFCDEDINSFINSLIVFVFCKIVCNR